MKFKQKILCLILALCITAVCLPFAVSAETAAPKGLWTEYAAAKFAGGTGTKGDPYQIATAEQLALLAKEVNSGSGGTSHTGHYFILTNDIDLSGHVWKPLGYESYASGGSSAQSFEGYFDGNGKKITGLYVDERTGDSWGKNRNSGLFGCVTVIGSDPVIQNLTIENGTVLSGDGGIEEEYGVGLLVGHITTSGGSSIKYGTIKNCTVSGTVTGTKYAGGLAGDAAFTHFESCRSDAKVNGYCASGGFVGMTFKSEFKDCVAAGDVKSTGWSTGGFAGILFHNTVVKHCAALGEVEANNWNLGGFVGYLEDSSTVQNSIAMGDVKSNLLYNPKAGGFTGTAINGSKVENCHAAGKITTAHSGDIGGFIAVGDGSSAASCSFDNEKNPALSGVGAIVSGTYGATGAKTAEVLSNICTDYYGGHDMKAVAAEKATCTKNGHEAGTECARCKHREGFAVISATGHTGGTATCKEKAVCTVCREVYGNLNPNNHANLKHTAAKAATANAEGNIEYWYCDGCGKYYSDAAAQTEITKAGTVKAKLAGGKNSPNTRDGANLILLTALAFVSGGAAVGTAVYTIKKKHSEN